MTTKKQSREKGRRQARNGLCVGAGAVALATAHWWVSALFYLFVGLDAFNFLGLPDPPPLVMAIIGLASLAALLVLLGGWILGRVEGE
jgi:hypothetical protein